jgi:hypothetical protein
MGIGWACILGPSTVAALSSLPESMGAVAMGSSWTLHNMGGAVGLALGTVVYNIYARSAWGEQRVDHFLSGYAAAMWLLFAVSSLALLVVVFGMKPIKK